MKNSRFTEGDTVLVAGLGQAGQVNRVLPRNRYEVCVGSFTIVSREADLSAANTQKPHRAKVTGPKKTSTVSNCIDLHGLTTSEAQSDLENWLNSLILQNTKQGRVIHGLGTGALKELTHVILSQYSAVRAYRINPSNPGETLIHL